MMPLVRFVPPQCDHWAAQCSPEAKLIWLWSARSPSLPHIYFPSLRNISLSFLLSLYYLSTRAFLTFMFLFFFPILHEHIIFTYWKPLVCIYLLSPLFLLVFFKFMRTVFGDLLMFWQEILFIVLTIRVVTQHCYGKNRCVFRPYTSSSCGATLVFICTCVSGQLKNISPIFTQLLALFWSPPPTPEENMSCFSCFNFNLICSGGCFGCNSTPMINVNQHSEVAGRKQPKRWALKC